MALNVNRIHHIGILLHDAESALPLYRDTLGMPVVKDEILEDQGVRGIVLDAGDGAIELLEPIRDDTGAARFLKERGEDIHHVCFETDDVAAELQRAKALGMQLIDETPRHGLAGMVGFIHPRSSHGVLVELAQPTEERESAPVTADPNRPFGISGIDHVGIAVRDIHAGAEHFSEKFNMPVFKEWGPEEETGLESISVAIGAGYLEIVTSHDPTDANVYVERFLRQHGDGIAMMSLKVRNFPAALESIGASGYSLTEPVYYPHKMVLGRPLMHIPRKQASGVRLQLLAESPVELKS